MVRVAAIFIVQVILQRAGGASVQGVHIRRKGKVHTVATVDHNMATVQ